MFLEVMAVVVSFGMGILAFRYGTSRFYETKGGEGWNDVTFSALCFITGILFLLDIVEKVMY